MPRSCGLEIEHGAEGAVSVCGSFEGGRRGAGHADADDDAVEGYGDEGDGL